jgi:hypothetical protein
MRHPRCMDRIFTLISAAVPSAVRLWYLRPFEVSWECGDVTNVTEIWFFLSTRNDTLHSEEILYLTALPLLK